MTPALRSPFLIRRSFLLATAACLALPRVGWTADDTTSRIDDLLKPFDRDDAPGISVSVIRQGQVVYKRGLGLAVLDNPVPVTSQTNFRLASLSKAFTAMAVLILVRRGSLRLDTTLSEIFPDFPAYGANITVRQLLNHTSGLVDFAESLDANRTTQVQNAEVFAILKAQKGTVFTPGSQFEYSNSGYVMLAWIVQTLSGISFAAFLKANIFDVLGMSHTVAYEAGISAVANRALGYSPAGNGFNLTDQSLTSATLGDGGVYSSVDDLFAWDSALYTDKLIGADLLRQAFTPGSYGDQHNPDSGYGFGWFIDRVQGHLRYWHGGGTAGFHNHIVRFPDDRLTVIVLMNNGAGQPEAIASQISRIFLPGLTPDEPRVVEVPAAKLRTFSGYYDFRGSLTWIEATTERLIWTGVGPDPVVLLPMAPDTFFYADAKINPDRNWALRFEPASDSGIDRIAYLVDGKPVFYLAALGPLGHDLAPQPDPDETFTRTVAARLAEADKPSLTFLQSVSLEGKGVERGQKPVDRVVKYKVIIKAVARYLLVFAAPDLTLCQIDTVDV